MRKNAMILLLGGLILALPVMAQSPSLPTSGMRTVTMKPMDTTRVMTPPQMSKFHPQFQPQKTMSASKFFPKLSLGTWPPQRVMTNTAGVKNNPVQIKPTPVSNPLMPQK